MPLRLFKKKRAKHNSSERKLVDNTDENAINGGRAQEAAQQELKATPTTLNPTFSQKVAACKSRVDHVTHLADILISENHPDVRHVKERQENLQQEWAGLKERFDEHQLKYFFKDLESTKAFISRMLVELSYTHIPTSLPAVEAQQAKLDQVQITALEERVHCLKDEGEVLSEEHQDSSGKIKTAHSELSSTLSKLAQKVAERKLELEHAHKLQVFIGEFKHLTDDLFTLRKYMADDDVAELRQKGEHLAQLMERGELLSDMLEEAEGLASTTAVFAKTADELRKKEKKKKNCCVC